MRSSSLYPQCYGGRARLRALLRLDSLECIVPTSSVQSQSRGVASVVRVGRLERCVLRVRALLTIRVHSQSRGVAIAARVGRLETPGYQ